MSGNAKFKSCPACGYMHDDACVQETCTVCKRRKVYLTCSLGAEKKIRVRTCPDYSCAGCELKVETHD
jgi:hypothetical protein